MGQKSFEEVIEEALKVECFEHLHPQIIPMLTALKESDIRIGLITNCYFEERDAIRNSVLFDYFDAVCMLCELGIKQPDKRKDGFLQAESPMDIVLKAKEEYLL